VLAALWAAYCGLHSLLATFAVKRLVSRVVPALAGWYRAAYSLFALLTLIPLLGLMERLGGEPIWLTPSALKWTLLPLAGLVIAWSLRDYPVGEFLGLRPAPLEVPGEAGAGGPGVAFVLGVPHRFVRHPWYASALAVIWVRDMDQAQLVSAACWSLYILVGLRLEEARLEALIGEPYRLYRERVPALVPSPWRYLGRREADRLLRDAAGPVAANQRS